MKSTALCIIESGGKASKILHALRAAHPLVTWTVQATYGSIFDLPKKDLGVDVDNGFKLAWKPKAQKTIRALRKIASKVDEVYIATDADREGELIAAHVAKALKLKNVKRLRIYEITVDGVRAAFNEIAGIDTDLVASAEARRALDRLIGYKLSPFCWCGLGGGTSAGRVQSCVLSHVLSKEIRRRKHVPEPYHVVEVPIVGTNLKARSERLSDAGKASKLIKALRKAKVIRSVKQRVQEPPPPFHTAAALSFMAQTVGASTQETTRALQRLYESGLTSYCRTDSTRLSPAFVKSVRDHIQGSSPNQLSPDVRSFSSSKTSQGAHEALRPTNLSVNPSSQRIQSQEPLTRKLYTFLWARSLATQGTPAIYDDTTWTWVSSKGKPLLSLKVTKVKDKGWHIPSLQLFWKEPVTLHGKPELDLTRISTVENATEPPPRSSPAEVVRWMEKKGVGRPATYAGILDKLKFYGNIGGSKSLGTSLRGEALVYFLEKLVPDLLNPEFTARMESDLDRVAVGKLTYQTLMSRYWTWLEPLLHHTRLETQSTCPTCSERFRVKVAKRKPPQLLCGCKGTVRWAWVSPDRDFVPHTQTGLDGTCPKCKATKGFLTWEGKRGIKAKCLSCKTQHDVETIL
jgi:DNA topoisomerase-1